MDRSGLFYGFLLAAFIPAAGAPAAVIFFLVTKYGALRFKAGVYEDYASSLRESPVSGGLRHGGSVDILRKLRREVSFEPYVDILAGRETQLKIQAIKKLSRQPEPENVELLKQATRDPSAEVRLVAANALLTQESDLNEKIHEASKECESIGSAEAHANLGELYHAYADSGLSPGVLQRRYYELASESYRQSLDMDTNQPGLILHYSRCLTRLGNYKRAKELLEHSLKLWPGNRAMVFLRNRAAFELGVFEDIPEYFYHMDAEEMDPSQEGVMAFWTHEE